MIGLFPDPYPGEIFYSICARFADRAPYRSAYATLEALFGKRIRTIVELPGNLNYLVSILPPGSRYDVECFIRDHTLFPLYELFLPEERVKTIRNGMGIDRIHGSHLRVGAAAGIKANKYLMYCPLCVEEDRDNYGECYWHREHQVPGIKVCAEHSVWLEESNISTDELRKFISAEKAIKETISPLDKANKSFEYLRAIACDVQWVFREGKFHIQGDNAIRERYISALIKCGFSTYSGNVKTIQLVEAFTAHYPQDFLRELGCELEGRHKRNWVARISQAYQMQHPIRHLLMIQFLGLSTEEFFRSSNQSKPFGEGPWYCLNPICNGYKHATIKEIHIGVSRKKGRNPIATLECPSCGYTYCRVGPDRDEQDKYRGKVIRYGNQWDTQLKQLWIELS